MDNLKDFEESFQFACNLYNSSNYTFVELDDYRQNCALCFYYMLNKGVSISELKQCVPKYYSKILYNMNKVAEMEYNSLKTFNDASFGQFVCVRDRYSIKMDTMMRRVADCIVCGYNNAKICEILDLTNKQLADCINKIKSRYLDLFIKGLGVDEKTTTI